MELVSTVGQWCALGIEWNMLRSSSRLGNLAIYLLNPVPLDGEQPVPSSGLCPHRGGWLSEALENVLKQGSLAKCLREDTGTAPVLKSDGLGWVGRAC